MESIVQQINKILLASNLDIVGNDNDFYFKIVNNINHIISVYRQIYGRDNDHYLVNLINIMIETWKKRDESLKKRDRSKANKGNWYTSQELVGMSLYVDRFSKDLKTLESKLPYFDELGVNFLHLMPIMQSPEDESDGGYAVSDYTKVDKRFGDIDDLMKLQNTMLQNEMFLMMDVVINHTSHFHEWAMKAKEGDKEYEKYFYTFPDRNIPDQFEISLPEIFPHSSPGNFTWSKEMNKWVMTVFNYYQWDLNYTNPSVFLAMMETIFFYGNLGIDILRIDAPAFIWKKMGTTCQNLDEAHLILKLFRYCVDISTPGMALLGEAIVAPKEIMKYFGNETDKECSIAYNATQMALQWDALASGKTQVMLQSQNDIYHKPLGCTWINYTRCHDDIGLGFSDDAIYKAGYTPFEHRRFLKEFYAGKFVSSYSKGLLFGVNPKTQDARISGTLASLCGLESAIEKNDSSLINIAIKRIILMQANSIFLGGIPMLYYGDELGYTNDYSFENDKGKEYDNRWAHRPKIDWKKNSKRSKDNTIENIIFEETKKLIHIRKSFDCFADYNNIIWLNSGNDHIIGFKRFDENQEILLLFNYSNYNTSISTNCLNSQNTKYFDLWVDEAISIVPQSTIIDFEPYQFRVLRTTLE